MSEFKILSERDHIRTRSAMYIGSITSEEISGILNFKYQTKKYIPGLVKIIEEISSLTKKWHDLAIELKLPTKIISSIEKDFNLF